MDDDPHPFPLRSLLVAAAATALCFLSLRWALISGLAGPLKKRAPADPKTAPDEVASGGAPPGHGHPNGDAAGRVKAPVAETPAVERQTGTGASMMEQLVPEITTHALSYLDYRSLCRLSMTNSAMRRAANDDGPWKTLYHKDFTVEQDNITPINGWKSYYAATKAIVNVNAEFYNIVRERSLPAMSRFWLQADYVKCIHGTGELYMGYSAVIDSWAMGFNWVQGGQGAVFQIRDVRARVLTNMAWVTMKAYVNVEGGPFHVTNIYEFHNGSWYMVHHHSSAGLIMDGVPDIMEV